MVALDRDAWRGHEVRLRRTSRRPYGRRRKCRGSGRSRVRGLEPRGHPRPDSRSRQVAIIRAEKSPARRLGLGYLNGNACLGLAGTTKTPHGLTTETSAQLPLMRVIYHRRLSID